MSFDDSYPRGATAAMLKDPGTFATTMVVALVDYYGTEFMRWAPETVRLETRADFGVEWPPTNFDRLMAGVQLVTTDTFYTNLPDFIDLCNILSGSPATPGVFDPADAAECAWGITEALLLAPPETEDPFSEEIRAYVGRVVEMEGIITPPDILKIGIMGASKKFDIQADFADDPEMFSAVWEVEAEKTAEINQLVRDRLVALVSQLGALDLRNGDLSGQASRMLENLSKRPG